MYRVGLVHSFHVCFYFSFFSVYFCTIYIFIIIIIICSHWHFDHRAKRLSLCDGWRFVQISILGKTMNHYRRNQSLKNQRKMERTNHLLLRDKTRNSKATGTFACPASRSFSLLKHLRKKRWVTISTDVTILERFVSLLKIYIQSII